MKKILIILLLFIPVFLYAQENILDGHNIEVKIPDMVIIITDTQIGISWATAFILQIDGIDSAKIILPTTTTRIPKRKWILKDYLITAGISILSLGIGAGLISIFK